MDILCPICAEPWDADELYDVWLDDGRQVEWKTARKLFAKVGCDVFNTQHNESGVGSEEAEISTMLFDLLGDDVDGIAAAVEDLWEFV